MVAIIVCCRRLRSVAVIVCCDLHQVLDASLWMEGGGSLATEVCGELLELHESLNDVLMYSATAHVKLLVSPLPVAAEWPKLCEHWRLCSASVRQSEALAGAASETLGSASLKLTVGTLKLWCESMQTFVSLSLDAFVETCECDA